MLHVVHFCHKYDFYVAYCAVRRNEGNWERDEAVTSRTWVLKNPATSWSLEMVFR